MTRLLLDTRLLLWWLSGEPRLPQLVVARVQAPEAEVFVSQASLGEMAIKVSLGRLQVDQPELERQVPLQGFRWLPIHNSQLLAVAALETDGEHRDPLVRKIGRPKPEVLLWRSSQSWPYTF